MSRQNVRQKLTLDSRQVKQDWKNGVTKLMQWSSFKPGLTWLSQRERAFVLSRVNPEILCNPGFLQPLDFFFYCIFFILHPTCTHPLLIFFILHPTYTLLDLYILHSSSYMYSPLYSSSFILYPSSSPLYSSSFILSFVFFILHPTSQIYSSSPLYSSSYMYS